MRSPVCIISSRNPSLVKPYRTWNNRSMSLHLVSVVPPPAPSGQGLHPHSLIPFSLLPLLPLASFFPQAFSTGKYSMPLPGLWGPAKLSGFTTLLADPPLTFVTLGSLRAWWAWWSLQVETERTGTWKPTTHGAVSQGGRSSGCSQQRGWDRALTCS